MRPQPRRSATRGDPLPVRRGGSADAAEEHQAEFVRIAAFSRQHWMPFRRPALTFLTKVPEYRRSGAVLAAHHADMYAAATGMTNVWF